MIIGPEGSSNLPSRDPMSPRSAAYRVVGHAFDRAAVDPRQWVREEWGDGMMLLIDASVWKVDIVGPFLDHLVAALAEYNISRRLQDWLRLRIALHAGEVRRDESGWGGDDLTMTFRLNQAQEVKQHLADAARAQCIIVASDHIYRAIIRHEERVAWTAHYRAIQLARLDDPARAWIRIPGYETPPEPPARTSSRAGEPDDSSEGRVLGPGTGVHTGSPAHPEHHL
ncbi:MAG: hypothetical protein ACRDQ5_28555 [Sciscionella sp.]